MTKKWLQNLFVKTIKIFNKRENFFVNVFSNFFRSFSKTILLTRRENFSSMLGIFSLLIKGSCWKSDSKSGRKNTFGLCTNWFRDWRICSGISTKSSPKCATKSESSRRKLLRVCIKLISMGYCEQGDGREKFSFCQLKQYRQWEIKDKFQSKSQLFFRNLHPNCDSHWLFKNSHFWPECNLRENFHNNFVGKKIRSDFLHCENLNFINVNLKTIANFFAIV